MKYDLETKFNIGDWVKIKQQVQNYNAIIKPLIDGNKKNYVSMGELHFLERKPQIFQIIEILVQQCYAGIQVNYCIRAVNNDGILKYTEPELELANEI